VLPSVLVGATFYPAGWTLDVPKPGYGELFVFASRRPDVGPPLVTDDWDTRLDGPEIGEFLTQVTARAAGQEPEPGQTYGATLPPFVTQPVAQSLLPTLQRAVTLAVAGTDRYERIFPDPHSVPPVPYCISCNEGTSFDRRVLPSAWCDEFGHQAFGMGVTNWSIAQTIHDLHLERWRRAQEQA
jgi:hypothetical protein